MKPSKKTKKQTAKKISFSEWWDLRRALRAKLIGEKIKDISTDEFVKAITIFGDCNFQHQIGLCAKADLSAALQILMAVAPLKSIYSRLCEECEKEVDKTYPESLRKDR